jgi:hypothetical protein
MGEPIYPLRKPLNVEAKLNNLIINIVEIIRIITNKSKAMFTFKNYIRKSKIQDRITELEEVHKEIMRAINYRDSVIKQAGLHARAKQIEFSIHELEDLL